MKLFFKTIAIGAISIGVSTAYAAAIATVNGTEIPQERADVLIKEQVSRGTPNNAELQAQVRDELVRRELIAQEARKQGLDKRADVVAQMDIARQAILLRSYMQEYIAKNPVSEAAIKAEYDKAITDAGTTEYKLRHILVGSEAEATAIITKLKAGEKFATLAKQSQDPGSKENGGELGWSVPGVFVEPFANSVKALKKGGFTQTPVKTEFGYHVILLEDVRPLKAPALAEIRPQIEQRLRAGKIDAYVQQLVKSAKIN